LKVVNENYPEGQVDELDAVNNPEDPAAGSRKEPFGREIYIERDDIKEDPPKKIIRQAPRAEVRQRYAYFITCTGVVKNDAGEVTELRCTYDPATRGGDAPDGRKVKGTIHWVSAAHARTAEVRLYDHLFAEPDPGARGNFVDDINPNSLTVLPDAKIEPAMVEASLGEALQFERQGYFCLDADSTPGKPVFNRTVALRDTWAKIQSKGGAA
jgi:glutaminyl-tRNA synthetase